MARPHGFPPIVATVLLLMGAGFLGGCSGERTDQPALTPPADTLANGLRRDVATELVPWLGLWKAAIPDFVADSLQFRGKAQAFRGGSTQPSSDFDSLAREEAAAVDALSERSPGGRHRLIFDRYRTISEADGVGAGPDSAPLLIDDALGVAHTFEFCGTPCGYDWGCWVDSVTFALGGWAELDHAQDSFSGMLGIYSLLDSTVSRYSTPPVSSGAYERYRAAWEAWVANRDRALRAAPGSNSPR